jgi:hypothetical protein
MSTDMSVRQLRTELEGLGASLTVIKDCLLVTTDIGAITPALRDRIAQQREELLTLVEESKSQKPVRADPIPDSQRQRARAVSVAQGMTYAVKDVATVHGAIIITMQMGRAFTGLMLAPADKYDEATLREVLQQAIDTPIH